MDLGYNKKLILEDGSEYYGYGFGSDKEHVTEIVFNTSPVGYQEIVSDPSYTYQTVVMSYPMIGNYGINNDDFETTIPTIGGLVVREYNDRPSNFRSCKTLSELMEQFDIPGISGIDTRKLSRSIRDSGSRKALITDVSTSLEEAMNIIKCIYPDEKTKWYVKAPAFSFSKLSGMDAYLSPEMKSTGEAIGYDRKLSRAMYKALIASGVKMHNYGTVIVTLADEDKEKALPLIERFYSMGFNIEATVGTGEFLKANGVRTRIRGKLSEGSTEILDVIRTGYVAYVINTRAIMSGIHNEDGIAIRRCATENNVTMFTSLDTVRVLLDVLEEITISFSAIDEE